MITIIKTIILIVLLGIDAYLLLCSIQDKGNHTLNAMTSITSAMLLGFIFFDNWKNYSVVLLIIYSSLIVLLLTVGILEFNKRKTR